MPHKSEFAKTLDHLPSLADSKLHTIDLEACRVTLNNL
jgi:hypothetical protein